MKEENHWIGYLNWENSLSEFVTNNINYVEK